MKSRKFHIRRKKIPTTDIEESITVTGNKLTEVINKTNKQEQIIIAVIHVHFIITTRVYLIYLFFRRFSKVIVSNLVGGTEK